MDHDRSDFNGSGSGAPSVNHERQEKRFRWPWILLVVILWLLAAGGSLAWAGSQGRSGLRAAERARDAALVDVTSPTVLAEMRRALGDFRAAARGAGAAHVTPLRVVPVLGRQIRSLERLAAGASAVASVSVKAVEAGQTALETTPGGRAHAPALLRRLSDIAFEADRGLAGVQLGPSEALAAPLHSAREKLSAQLDQLRMGLRRGAAGAQSAAALLQGPRRYLVLAANNAEMRAGSGMFLTAGLLETNDGALELSPFRPTEDLRLPEGAVPLEGDLAARWGWLKPNEEWRNLAASPRFDETAPLAAAMWRAGGGEPVDGVLAVDPVALKAILVAVGSVDVEGRTITADSVVDLILHAQYVEHAGNPGQDARREELGQIASAVMKAVESRDWKADRLARELAGAARGRHLLAWSSRPAEQEGWVAAGLDGSLRRDSLMVSILNRGGNKLDRFLRVRADIQLHSGDGDTHGVLRLTVRNETPPGEPPYVAGPHPDSGVGEGVYLGVVAVTLPGDARDARIEGENNLAVAGADGPTRVVGATIQAPPQEERTVVVHFLLPYKGGSLHIEPTARVPGVEWTSGARHWQDGSSHTLLW